MESQAQTFFENFVETIRSMDYITMKMIISPRDFGAVNASWKDKRNYAWAFSDGSTIHLLSHGTYEEIFYEGSNIYIANEYRYSLRTKTDVRLDEAYDCHLISQVED